MKPPNFSTIFTPSSMALIVLSAVVIGTGGVAAAGTGVLEGPVFDKSATGFAGTDFETIGAPGAFMEVLDEGVVLAADEAGALDLERGAEVADLGATLTLGVADASVLAIGLVNVVVLVAGLLIGVVDVDIVCLEAPFVGLGAMLAPTATNFFTVPVAGVGELWTDFWVTEATCGAVLAGSRLGITGLACIAGEALTAVFGSGSVGLTSAILTYFFRKSK
jgi:hypothetical protein